MTLPEPEPAEESWRVLRAALSSRIDAATRLDLRAILEAVREWFDTPIDHVERDDDWTAIELSCASIDPMAPGPPPPADLPNGGFALTFLRELPSTEGRGEHGIEVWYPLEPAWTALLPSIEWDVDGLVGWQSLARGGPGGAQLLQRDEVRAVLSVAADTPEKLVRLFATWAEDEVWLSSWPRTNLT